MNNSAPSQEDLLRLEEAAEWVQELARNRLDDKLVEAWLEWCARDPRNQQAFDGISRVWTASGNLTSVPRASAEVGEAPAAPASRRSYKWFGALAASVLVAASAALLFWGMPREGIEDQGHAVITPTGVLSTSRLPDGSVMDLGGRTNVRLLYSSTLRRVDMLDGEVYLSVRKDKARAFVVTAGPVRVTAVGTAFNVRRDAERIVVTVNEGAVNVARGGEGPTVSCIPSANCVRVSSGQQVTYSNDAKVFYISTVDPDIATSWRTGVLKFVDEPLSSVVASVNRYSPRAIVIRDKDLRTLSFSGTVHIRRIEHWLRALEQSFPLSVMEDSGDKDVTLVPRG